MSGLTMSDIHEIGKRLNVLPSNLNGQPFATKVRRGEIERRRISLIKAEKFAPNQREDQELFRLAKYNRATTSWINFGWALRSRVTGDYFVFSEVW